MRARPNLSGEQLVTDYMTRVAQAARLLPKGARMAFVGRTRALVEREVGPPGTRTDPGHVSAVLERLGKPEDLVVVERTRIDQGWVKSRAASKEEGEAAAAALTGPRMSRPLTARRQPLTARPAPPGQDQTITAPDGTVIGAGPPPGTGPRRSMLRPGPRNTGARPAGQRGAGPRTGTQSSGPRTAGPRRLQSAGAPGTAPQGTAPQGTAPQGTAPQGTAPQGTAPQGTAPRGTAPRGAAQRAAGEPEVTGHASTIGRLIGQIPGKRPGSGTETFSSSAGQLARDNVRETVAILLLGLGGLILPFPFWPLGAIVAMFSRIWDIKDKSLAVAGPLLVTLLASTIVAVFVGGSGNVIVAYFHAVHVSFGLLVRVGSVITAAYLAWRVSKGPRVKAPPWQRIRR
jgi:hypothetical protein